MHDAYGCNVLRDAVSFTLHAATFCTLCVIRCTCVHQDDVQVLCMCSLFLSLFTQLSVCYILHIVCNMVHLCTSRRRTGAVYMPTVWGIVHSRCRGWRTGIVYVLNRLGFTFFILHVLLPSACCTCTSAVYCSCQLFICYILFHTLHSSPFTVC